MTIIFYILPQLLLYIGMMTSWIIYINVTFRLLVKIQWQCCLISDYGHGVHQQNDTSSTD